MAEHVTEHVTEQPIEPEARKEDTVERKHRFALLNELPYWFIYIAWTVCVLVILACSIIIVFYGMQFGNVKSLQWLATITFSLVQDVLLLQPARVMLVALFFAFVLKKFKG